MKNTVLVVPTIRENCLIDFMDRWNDVKLFDHVDLIVMEDNPKRTFEIPEKFRHLDMVHLCWETIEETLKEDSWIIPRRSDTVRSFAYWYAANQGYEYILTLDDDCYPTEHEDGLTYDGEGFVGEHKKALESRSRWFNTLNSVKPRGVPFYNIGSMDTTMVNHGLWTKVLDYDAPFQLANPIPEKFSFDNRIVPAGMYFPMCGMNVMWKRGATVLMYHLLMGQMSDPQMALVVSSLNDPGYRTLKKLPFDRFGDIWCGIFMKKILDGLGLNVSSGMPYIRHERASNPFANLKKEANGIEVNEKLWSYVDKFQVDVRQGIVYNYMGLANHIKQYTEFPEHDEYFKTLGEAMLIWARLFSEV